MVRRLNRETPAEAFARRVRSDRAFVVMFKIAFDLENRLRSLEGRPAVSKAQFRASVRALYEAGG